MVTASDMGQAGRALVAAVALERGAELLLSRRNARRLRARGAVEAGREHYPAMVAFHAALLVACIAEPALRSRPWPLAVAAPAAAVVLLAEALRWWAVSTLGERWSTRVLVLPRVPPIRAGPYRWLRHPNYLAVAAEVAALPLAAGAWGTAIVGTALNAWLLRVRIGVEERAMRAGEGAGGAGSGVGVGNGIGVGIGNGVGIGSRVGLSPSAHPERRRSEAKPESKDAQDERKVSGGAESKDGPGARS